VCGSRRVAPSSRIAGAHLTSGERRERPNPMTLVSDRTRGGAEPPIDAPSDAAAARSMELPCVEGVIPGPNSRDIFEREQRYIAPGRQRISLLAGLALDHGEGATLTDADGNVYLDFVAGIGVASLGHAHPALVKALARQAGRL